MAKLNDIYKCEVCGNIIETIHAGAGTLACCGKPMKLMRENTVDAALEKHVPIIEQDGNKYTVKVGSAPHAMTLEHYIEWIELIVGNKIYRKYLKASDEPEAVFCIDAENQTISAREYCNLHGLWKNE